MPILILAAATAAAAAAQPVCQRPSLDPVAASGAMRVRPLGEQPPAKQILAVLHFEGRCQKPIVVRDQVGMPPQTSSTSRP